MKRHSQSKTNLGQVTIEEVAMSTASASQQGGSHGSQDSKYWALAALTGVPLIMVLGNSMLIPAFPQIKEAMQIDQFRAGLLITFFSIPAGLTIPFLGFLSDRLGRKKVIIPSLILYGLGGLISGLTPLIFANSYPVMLLGRVVQGIGAAGTAPVAMALVSDIFQSKARSKALGFLEATNGLGKVISPIAGAVLAVIAWWSLFFIYAFLSIPIAAAVYFLVRESSPPQSKSKGSVAVQNALKDQAGSAVPSSAQAEYLLDQAGSLPASQPNKESLLDQAGIASAHPGLALTMPDGPPKGSKPGAKSFSEYFAGVGKVFKKKAGTLLTAFLAGMLVLFTLFGILSYLSDALESQFNLQGVRKGLVLAIPVLTMASMSLINGYILQKYPRMIKPFLLIGLALFSTMLVLAGFIRSIPIVMGLMAVLGIGVGLVLPGLNTIVTSSSAEEERGAITSFYGGVRFIGVALGPPVFSLLEKVGLGIMYWSVGAAGILVLILTMVLLKTPKSPATAGGGAAAQKDEEHGLAQFPRPGTAMPMPAQKKKDK